jgi:hypothetical protein
VRLQEEKGWMATRRKGGDAKGAFKVFLYRYKALPMVDGHFWLHYHRISSKTTVKVFQSWEQQFLLLFSSTPSLSINEQATCVILLSNVYWARIGKGEGCHRPNGQVSPLDRALMPPHSPSFIL